MQSFFFSGPHPVIRGAFFLTAAGMLTRVMGFFYRIFLSRSIGAEQVGIYQMIFPVYGVLCAASSSGIQTAISRLTAAEASSGADTRFLRCGLFTALLLASLGSAGLLAFADPLAETLLGEPRCAPLLRALAFCVPLSSIHACISGFYYGLMRAAVPSLSLLAEQSARMLFIFMAWKISLQEGIALPLSATVWALGTGELAAVLFCVTAMGMKTPQGNHSDVRSVPAFSHRRTSRLQGRLKRKVRTVQDSTDCSAPGFRSYSLPGTLSVMPKLLVLALPLTANRLFISLLAAGEAALLPARLQSYGHSAPTALILYGVLTGMAMPLILFPTAITNAVSVLLLPAVTRTLSDANPRKLTHTIATAIQYCLVLGIFFFGVFFLYGNVLGTVLYKNALAGDFLRTLSFICPFLYLNASLSSILAGLGRTVTLFWHNTISLLLRLSFVHFLVPRYGMQAYFWGLLASLLCQTLCSLFVLYSYLGFSFPAVRWIVLPSGFLVLAAGAGFFAAPFLNAWLSGFPLFLLAGKIGVTAVFYFLLVFLYQVLPFHHHARPAHTR